MHKKSFYPQFPPPHSSYPQHQGIKSSKKAHETKIVLARSEKKFGSTWIENRLSTMAMGVRARKKKNIVGVFRFACFGWKYFPTTISLD